MVPIRAGASIVSVVQPKIPRLNAKKRNAIGFMRNCSFHGKLSKYSHKEIAPWTGKQAFSICQVKPQIRKPKVRNGRTGFVVVRESLAYSTKNKSRFPRVSARRFLFFSGCDFQFRIQCTHPRRASDHNQPRTSSRSRFHPDFRVNFRFEQSRLANPCWADFLPDELPSGRSSNAILSGCNYLSSSH